MDTEVGGKHIMDGDGVACVMTTINGNSALAMVHMQWSSLEREV